LYACGRIINITLFPSFGLAPFILLLKNQKKRNEKEWKKKVSCGMIWSLGDNLDTIKRKLAERRRDGELQLEVGP
jgi:hypothetical protein